MGVAVGSGVCVGVAVGSGVFVGVGMGVAVGAGVGVAVGSGVFVGVGTGVAVGAGSGVAVGAAGGACGGSSTLSMPWATPLLATRSGSTTVALLTITASPRDLKTTSRPCAVVARPSAGSWSAL